MRDASRWYLSRNCRLSQIQTRTKQTISHRTRAWPWARGCSSQRSLRRTHMETGRRRALYIDTGVRLTFPAAMHGRDATCCSRSATRVRAVRAQGARTGRAIHPHDTVTKPSPNPLRARGESNFNPVGSGRWGVSRSLRRAGHSPHAGWLGVSRRVSPSLRNVELLRGRASGKQQQLRAPRRRRRRRPERQPPRPPGGALCVPAG